MLWSFLLSFGSWLFNAFMRVGVVKFIIGAACFFVLEWFWDLCEGLLGGYTSSGLSTAFGGLGQGVLYFLGVMQLHIGLPMLLAAYVTRFSIRRIPFIG